MALKIKFAWKTGKHALLKQLLLIGGGVVALLLIVGFCVFEYTYFKYRGIVQTRFEQPVFIDTAKIFAAPREVRPGQKMPVNFIANELREAGYTEEGTSPELRFPPTAARRCRDQAARRRPAQAVAPHSTA